MKIKKNSVFYSAMLLSFSGMLLQLLGFIYRIMISRLTGADGMAIYQLIWPVYGMISSISITGICAAMTRITAERQTLGIGGNYKLMRVCRILFLTAFFAVSVPVALGSKWIASGVLGVADTRLSLLILIPCLFLTGFENLYKAAFHGTRRVQPTMISEVGELAIRIISGAALLVIFHDKDPGFKAAMIVAGMLISEIMSTAFIGSRYRKHFKNSGGAHIKGLTAKIMSFALPIAGAGLLSNIISSATLVSLPRLLVQWGLSKDEAMRSYGVLMGMVSPLLMFPMILIGALSTVMMPIISAAEMKGGIKDRNRKISLSIYVTGLFSIPITALVIPIGPALCNMLFNQIPDRKFFFFLAIVTLLLYYLVILGSILNGMGKQKQNAAFGVISGVLQFGVTVIAVPKLGIYGYIIGQFAGSALDLAACLIVVVRHAAVDIRWVKWFVSPAVTSALCAFITKWGFDMLTDMGITPILRILAAALGGALIYGFLMNIQGVQPARYLKTLIADN